MKLRVAPALLGLLVAFASPMAAAGATRTDADAAAVKALKSQLRLLTNGETGKEWLQLHPAQQQIVPRDRYVFCTRKAHVIITSVRIKAVAHEKIVIPGTTVMARTTTITADLTGVDGKSTPPTTFHEIQVGKTWRFTLPNPAIYAPESRSC